MRSDFLVHWTGRDICTRSAELTAQLRSAYIDRLADVLSNGFWMTLPTEHVQGFNGSWIQYQTPMTCFTEIRLSQAQEHASRYGLLGVGVDRRFVLDRYGGPVHYVRNHPVECMVGNLKEINTFLSSGSPLIHAYFGMNVSFVKAMSNPNSDDFQFLNEHEWRIVYSERQQQENRIVATGLPHPKYRVSVTAADLRLLVFPDPHTRTAARSDPRINSWLRGSAGLPILLTIEELYCAPKTGPPKGDS